MTGVQNRLNGKLKGHSDHVLSCVSRTVTLKLKRSSSNSQHHVSLSTMYSMRRCVDYALISAVRYGGSSAYSIVSIKSHRVSQLQVSAEG
jgi:hypothetical protein